jgi:hypothetical protein
MCATARAASRASCTNGSSSVCAPASRTRLIVTMSFQGTRVTGAAGVPATARSMPMISLMSAGACSLSSTRKS